MSTYPAPHGAPPPPHGAQQTAYGASQQAPYGAPQQAQSQQGPYGADPNQHESQGVPRQSPYGEGQHGNGTPLQQSPYSEGREPHRESHGVPQFKSTQTHDSYPSQPLQQAQTHGFPSHAPQAHHGVPPPPVGQHHDAARQWQTTPIPVQVQYVLPYETVLVLNEKRCASGDEMITDSAGMVQFRLREKPKSLHNKETLFDNSGRAAYSTMQKSVSTKKTTYICIGDEPSEKTAIAEVRKVTMSLKPQAHVFFRTSQATHPDIVIKGALFERTFKIVNAEDKVLAEATRDKSSHKNGGDTYSLHIFPGADSALMVILVSIIDEVLV